MLGMMSTATDFNAKAPRREDAEKIENVVAALIVDAVIEVHRTLGGPGLLESCFLILGKNFSVMAWKESSMIYKNLCVFATCAPPALNRPIAEFRKNSIV
jgi:hypothetical protein